MEITTSWEEAGLRRGRQEGVQRERELVLRLLAQRVGVLSKQTEQALERLPIEQVELLAEAMFNFKGPSDLTHWLSKHAASAVKTSKQ